VLPVGWLVVAVLAAVLLSMWVTFTLTRLDRLHARIDAARAALDAQLVRRAAALLQIAEAPETGLSDADRDSYQAIAQAALAAGATERRETVENAVGRAVLQLSDGSTVLSDAGVAELHEAAARVQVSRRFYNDAVRDTRTLRARRMPRVLRLAGRVELPQFFDIDDTLPSDGRGLPPREPRPAGGQPEPSPAPAKETS